MVLANGDLVSAGGDKTIRIWNTDTARCKRVIKGHAGVVMCLTILADGQLASGSADRTVRVWNLETKKCKILTEHTG